ncbi:hypothetical protein [Branchiibius sp. NY16-3462-2]|uniref:hypothetical protein n=1 Tax=Branchiibius sp. NY16-3462-2 TaxID=1807500 RepID=UPI0025C1B6B7|nr:hypothetical protein [Branchiibius sp. NY16-3462-2]
MRRAGGAAVAAALSIAVLTGCSSGTSTTSGTSGTATTSTTAVPTPVTTTATGASVYGAYAFVQPAAWVVDAGRQTKGVTTYLKAPQPVSGVIPTFTVATSTVTPVPTLDDLATQGAITARQRGATVTNVADRIIGGEPAQGYVVTSSTPKTGTTGTQALSQTQYFVIHGGTIYVTTFTSSPASAPSLKATQDAILGSWSWTAP